MLEKSLAISKWFLYGSNQSLDITSDSIAEHDVTYCINDISRLWPVLRLGLEPCDDTITPPCDDDTDVFIDDVNGNGVVGRDIGTLTRKCDDDDDIE